MSSVPGFDEIAAHTLIYKNCSHEKSNHLRSGEAFFANGHFPMRARVTPFCLYKTPANVPPHTHIWACASQLLFQRFVEDVSEVDERQVVRDY